MSAARISHPSRSWSPLLTKERKAEHDFRNLLMEYQVAVWDHDDALTRFVLEELLKAFRERPAARPA